MRAAVAGTTTFTADLNGSFEVPPTDSKAKGKGDFLYDDTSKKLTWTITYRGLSDKAKAAHLHGPAKRGGERGHNDHTLPAAKSDEGCGYSDRRTDQGPHRRQHVR